MSGSVPSQVGPGCIGKVAEAKLWSKSVSDARLGLQSLLLYDFPQ